MMTNISTQRLFIAAILVFMFLTRIVQKGMFGDSLLYSSIARNMAEGRGEWWKPFFSSTYWVPNLPVYYYENPPLMLWLQALYFRIMGDSWWTEKSFGVLVFLANIWMMKWVWQSYFKNSLETAKKWYLLPFFWYLLLVVSWGNTNNLMDNMLLTFCLAAVALVFKGIYTDSNNKYYFFVGAGIVIFLGLLVKGPVALYPLSVPIITWLIKKNTTFEAAILATLLLISVTILAFVLMYFTIPEAAEYFKIYWEQRLKAVIVGSREDIKLEGFQRFYIMGKVFIELIPTFVVVGLSQWYAIKNKISLPYRDAFIFILLGFAATLPILISTKQSGIYLIPGLPMFSFAALMLCIPSLAVASRNNMFVANKTILNSVLVVVLAFGLWLTFDNFGKNGREKDIISELEVLKPIIPSGSLIGVCDAMMEDFVMHTYMQRMNKYELKNFNDLPPYLILNSACDTSWLLNDNSYKEIQNKDLKYFKIYKNIQHIE